MEFSRLAYYFEKMEATTKRLELTDLLSNLFNESSKEDIDKIAYLIQGRLAPFFEPIEIGMAEKMIEQSIARSYGIDREEVRKLFTKLGDWGDVASQLNFKFQISNLPAGRQGLKSTVREVHQELCEIATTTGVGSIEKKISAFCELLTSVDHNSCRYLVRIPLGTMRLGIGDPTILDALSVAKVGDKTLRPVLEEAYNKTSDLGLIAKVFWSGGVEEVKRIKVQVGKPIRPQLSERLPDVVSVINKLGEVSAEPKYDGFRVQIHFDRQKSIGLATFDGELKKTKVKIFSRNLEDMSHMFPEITEAALKQIEAKSAILDGEAIAYNPLTGEFLPFQETTRRRRKHGIEESAKNLPLRAFIFDCLFKDGKDLMELPYRKRREVVKEIVRPDTLIPSEALITSSAEELEKSLQEKISSGLEGLVVKRLETSYQAGARNFNWIKLKRNTGGELQDTVDCVLLGYIYGTGKRTDFGVGALLAGVYDQEKDEFVSICKIGTGLTDEEFREIKKRADKFALTKKSARINSLIIPSVWLEPRIVIEVLADEITRSPVHTAGMNKEASLPAGRQGYALRFPRLVSFRSEDKRPEDATTVEEIIKMYKQQAKVKIS